MHLLFDAHLQLGSDQSSKALGKAVCQLTCTSWTLRRVFGLRSPFPEPESSSFPSPKDWRSPRKSRHVGQELLNGQRVVCVPLG